MTTRESTLAYFNSLPWRNNPYSAYGRIGHALIYTWPDSAKPARSPLMQVTTM